MPDIYFRQLNCQHGTAASFDIQTRLNQVHLLTEPYFTSTGEVGVDNKNKCFYDASAVNTVAKEYPRAAIYAPNLTDASIMPVDNLISRDCSAAVLENTALRKPVLIVSIYCDQTKNMITEDLRKIVKYSSNM